MALMRKGRLAHSKAVRFGGGFSTANRRVSLCTTSSCCTLLRIFRLVFAH